MESLKAGVRAGPGRVWARPGRTEWLAVAALVLGVILFAWTAWSSASRTTAIDNEVALIDETQRLLSTMFSLESSERGYVLTGLPEFLEPYEAAIALLGGQIEHLGEVWGRAGADPATLDALRDAVAAQNEFAARVVALRTGEGVDAAGNLVRTGQGKERMDVVRSIVASVQEGAATRISSLTQDRQWSELVSTIAFAAAAVAALALAGLALRRQQRLRDAEGRFRSLVETTAAIVWSATADGRFGPRQESWAAFTGQGEADYVGEGWVSAVHPDDRARSAAAWKEATRTHTPYSIEHRVQRQDGQWREMLANAVPIFAPDGHVREWVGTHTDITEHKQTAALLRETNSQFQALADNIPQMAWMARPDGRIFWYNKRWFEFTGTTLEEMRDFGWTEVHHPDHAQRVRAGYDAALAEGRDWEDTFPLRAADGTYRWFLSQAVPIRGANGAILRWFGTNTDVTRQRAQERELEAAKELAENANRAKSQFIANMSHELRTPLTAVIGYTEMLEEEVEEMGEKHLLADLGKINANARHLLGLINDVLDLSKIEAERMEIYPETFEVEQAVSDIASTVGALMEKKENRLVLDLGPDLGEAHTDQVKLRQCIINLLSNAAKFTEHGTITLRVRREKEDRRDWLVFEVADDGIGMSPEQLARLFQRFTQADASTTRKFGGTGLGLAITKAFCKLLGGDIAVVSRENEGSTFTIKLPAIALASVVEAPALRPIPAEERQASSGVVLAIDDDPNARDLVARFLTREGFLVRTAADGLAGLELAALIRPDVILLDVTMPRMDGWSVLTALKADADLSRIPVVMLTVIDEHSLGYALGASDYLLKPVEWAQLRKVLDKFRTRDAGRVLAVDDDQDLLARMRALLEKEGFEVMTAGDGREALEAVARQTPDLILTDLVMPRMDGFALIRALRERPDTAQVPIVVLTSKDLTREEFRRLRPDTEEVVSKNSIELPELASQIRVIVAAATQAPTPSTAPTPDANA